MALKLALKFLGTEDRRKNIIKDVPVTSFGVQWLRVHWLIQDTQVGSLVQEESICCEATKPMHQCTRTNMIKDVPMTSLVVQWLRIHLPMQETQVGSLVREDPTCHRKIKPVSHSY